ncbi:hypothetical protein [Rhodoferax sp. PAMC 29310]|uniref:hypothetical protein n=1 Tax=Rhodoferax sp. PAMC 29310 TaxID=2822760 RepID=UPI001B340BD8|nr:hypothetical protein [Rhodoferax sp. PAMC 29310]
MTNSELRFGKDAHPILRELQSRIDAIPKESLNFVAAMIADGVITTPPLSDLIFGMIYIRNGISIEPIHQALSTVVALRNQHSPAQAKLRDEKLAFVLPVVREQRQMAHFNSWSNCKPCWMPPNDQLGR